MKLFSDTAAWHKAGLHTHTTISDGKLSPEEAIAVYRENGYDVLAITDHRVSGYTREEPGFIVMGAIECNVIPDFSAGDEETYHVLGLGMPEGYVQKTGIFDEGPEKIIAELKSQGALCVLAHPAWSLNTPEHILALEGIDAVEIFNTVSGFPTNPGRADASAVLDPVFSKGRLIPLFASDDTHYYKTEKCVAATMIQTDDFTVKGLLDAVKAGKSYATTGPRINQIEIEGDVIRVSCSPSVGVYQSTNHAWVGGSCVTAENGLSTSFELKIGAGTTFVRLTVIDENGRMAWTNPIKTV